MDPFGFDSLTLDRLRAKPGGKWHKHQGLLGAWVADMDFPPPPVVVQALQGRLDAGDLCYPDWRYPGGGSPASDVFCERALARYGWSIDVGRVREVNDVVQGIQIVLHLCTSAGDGVIVHVPAYPPFLHSIDDNRRVLVPVRTFDLAEVEAAAGHARALLLCNPHNPTGHVFTATELRGLADIAERHDLLIIADEIHADLVYHPHVHRPMALYAPERTVTVSAASKAFNIAGLRYALMHVGPQWVWDRFKSVPDHLFGATNLAGSLAAEAAWRDGDEWLAAAVAHLDRQRHLLADLLGEHLPEVRYTVPDATYLAWLDCRRLGFGDDPSAVFAERGVRLSEGPNFGPEGNGFARLNFATSSDVLREIVSRMSTTANDASRGRSRSPGTGIR